MKLGAPVAWDEALCRLGSIGSLDQAVFVILTGPGHVADRGNDGVDVVFLEHLGGSLNVGVVDRDEADTSLGFKDGIGLLELVSITEYTGKKAIQDGTHLAAQDNDFVSATSLDALDKSAAQTTASSGNSDDNHFECGLEKMLNRVVKVCTW